MNPDLAATLVSMMLRLSAGMVFLWLLYVTSRLVFGFSFRKEIQKGNKASALFWAGIAVMVGLVVALFRG